MALESGTYISDLNPSNPVGATDKVSTLDDHVRLIKSTLQNTFPNIDGAVTATEDELNHLDGVTGTTGTGKLVLDDAPTIADLTVTDSITLPAASIADAALSSNVPLKDTRNVFTTGFSTAAGGAIVLQANGPGISFVDTGADENEANYSLRAVGGVFRLQFSVDDNVGGNTTTPLRIFRTGTVVDEIELNATSVDVSGVVTVSNGSAAAPAYSFSGDTDLGIYRVGANNLGITAGNSAVAQFSQTEIDLTATTIDINGDADISGSLTVGSARIASEGGVIYHDSTDNLGGKIVLSSSAAVTAGDVGAPGDMRFVYA